MIATPRLVTSPDTPSAPYSAPDATGVTDAANDADAARFYGDVRTRINRPQPSSRQSSASRSRSWTPITLGAANFVTSTGIRWGDISAATVLSTLPPILFAVFAQRYLVSGLAAGAVKG